MTTELYVLLPLTFVAAMLNASVGGGGLVLVICLLAKLVMDLIRA